MRNADELYCHECGLVFEPGVRVALDGAGRLICEFEDDYILGVRVGWLDIACGGTGEREGSRCMGCAGTGVEIEEIDPGLEDDERDMAQIAREWEDYDRDPPGS